MAAGDEPERTLAHYLMRLLDFLGYRPQLRTCASCDGALVEGEAYFAPSAGGVLCPDCAAGAGDARALTTATLKVLRVLEAGDRDTYRRLRLTSALRRELSAVLRGQLEYHLDGRIRSFEFLDRIVD
jgi:DNA repair protein RecO (recombination protein O)